MEKVNTVVKSTTAPKDTDVIWINPSDNTISVFDKHKGWVPVSGSGMIGTAEERLAYQDPIEGMEWNEIDVDPDENKYITKYVYINGEWKVEDYCTSEQLDSMSYVVSSHINRLDSTKVSSDYVKTIWRGTQGQYESIDPKDNDTLYLVSGLKPDGYVDFGLPSGLLWAKYNLGATHGDTPESWYGNYYAWGELEEKAGWDGQGTKVPYDWTTYKYANGAEDKLTKYCNSSNYGDGGYTDALTELEPVDDAVWYNYGGNWRIPTNVDFDELIDHTVNEVVFDYEGISGLHGRVFYKADITPAFIAEGITLYTVFDEHMQPTQTPVPITKDAWETLSVYTKEELDVLITQLSGGTITDVTTIIFKDAVGTLADYGVDYAFTVKDVDKDVSMFIPYAGRYYDLDAYDYDEGVTAYLWTQTYAYACYSYAQILPLDSHDSPYISTYERCFGFSVRPVLVTQVTQEGSESSEPTK